MSNQAIDGKTLKQMILHAARNLEAHKDAVNALNVFPVPDGDTGTNMAATMNSATREVERAQERTASEVAAAMAQGSLMGARGNSGVILSQLFRGFAKGMEGKVTLDGPALARAFQEGVDTAYKAVMKPVEGTILTVARESAAAGMAAARRVKDPVDMMKLIVEAADASLARTPEMLPVLKKAGVVDSGGKGFALILHGYYMGLTGGEIIASAAPAPVAQPARADKHDTSPAARIDFKVDEEIADIKFPYDCEFFIRRYPGGQPIPLEQVGHLMDSMGDSIYVVGSEDYAKVHIHASNPGPVLSLCIQYGDLVDIVIHNMREQHADLMENVSHAAPPEAAPEEYDENSIGVVAVAVGDGLADIFRSLGVQEIIQGGQTMNPSTQDLLDAIENCPAHQVFVLPNNKNIILAAEQAAALTDKKVYVVPSRSIPQGIAAMVSFLPEGDAEKLHKSMTKALENVQTGEITFSVRDTVFGDIEIKEGDILGLWNGKIALTGKSPEAVVSTLLGKMIEEKGGEVISLFWGEGSDEQKAGALADSLRKEFPDHEIEVQYGGQPLYFYVFSLE
ncbi:MAG TPA: DAK2 domain-containing protein [Symbiobacteriaceae bacterium]|nr:DAK2 domain-containing protein [Symbiobacteriaceae bacterium]